MPSKTARRPAPTSSRNVSPMEKFVRWSTGVSPTPAEPASPEPVSAGSYESNLPTVKPPPTPPRSSSGRPSARRATVPVSNESQLPNVASPTPPNKGGRSSSRPRTASPTPAKGQVEASASSVSPGPKKKASTGQPASRVVQSPPAAADGMSAGGNSNVGSACREMLEVQVHAQQLLRLIFDMEITEEASVSLLSQYPELSWLSNCLRRAPQPPGWTSVDAGAGQVKYVSMESGESTTSPPLLRKFAEMGSLMMHWRNCPSSVHDVATALTNKYHHALEEAARARKVWNGPHIDPNSGMEFWHCPATGRSAWGDPGLAAEFIARIAERLSRALPVSASIEGSSPAKPTAPPGRTEASPVRPGASPSRPGALPRRPGSSRTRSEASPARAQTPSAVLAQPVASVASAAAPAPETPRAPRGSPSPALAGPTASAPSGAGEKAIAVDDSVVEAQPPEACPPSPSPPPAGSAYRGMRRVTVPQTPRSGREQVRQMMAEIAESARGPRERSYSTGRSPSVPRREERMPSQRG